MLSEMILVKKNLINLPNAMLDLYFFLKSEY